MARRSADEYVAFARAAITELLDQEHAAGWLEVEAKIADTAWPGVPTRVDPHHPLTLRRLGNGGAAAACVSRLDDHDFPATSCAAVRHPDAASS